MEKKIIIFNYGKKKYISGYDLALINNLDMGIDSKLGYYEINDSLLDKIAKDGYQIEYKEMNSKESFKIRKEYFDEHGDRLYRIKNSSLSYLIEWKEDMEKYHDQEVFNKEDYDELVNEIEKRKEKKESDDKLRRKFLPVLKVLTDELGKDLVDHEKVKESLIMLGQILKPHLNEEIVIKTNK